MTFSFNNYIIKEEEVIINYLVNDEDLHISINKDYIIIVNGLGGNNCHNSFKFGV